MAASGSRLDADAALNRVAVVLGNAGDEPWPGRLAGARIDLLRLDQAEAQKSRLRKTTEGGTDVAIALDRGVAVRDGDVLAWNGAARVAVVARVELSDVLVIDVTAVAAEPAEAAMTTCIELGHALGNQHWPAVIKGTRVYVPLTVDKAVMASVLKTHDFDGISYEFAAGAEVIPYLAPHEARRLFGTAERHQHNNAPGQVSP
jgi:urease accessory protein